MRSRLARCRPSCAAGNEDLALSAAVAQREFAALVDSLCSACSECSAVCLQQHACYHAKLGQVLTSERLQVLLYHNWQFKVMHRKDVESQVAAARRSHQVRASSVWLLLHKLVLQLVVSTGSCTAAATAGRQAWACHLLRPCLCLAAQAVQAGLCCWGSRPGSIRDTGCRHWQHSSTSRLVCMQDKRSPPPGLADSDANGSNGLADLPYDPESPHDGEHLTAALAALTSALWAAESRFCYQQRHRLTCSLNMSSCIAK